MVKLAAELILKSPQYFNAVREREIDLRGNKIAVIENLGVTEDQFDSIDFSDNEIVKLDGFPWLSRLSTLIVNNNRIARISPTIGESLPKLNTLILTNNRLSNLADLDPLSSLQKLESLSLVDNVVTKKPNYRLYVIHKVPSLKVLDYQRVRQKERVESAQAFGDQEAVALAKKASVNTFVPGEVKNGVNGKLESVAVETKRDTKSGPTREQLMAIKAAIATAQTLDEVNRLESALRAGQIPEGILSSNNGDNSSAHEMEEKE